ncbi:hypothetical protein SDRG_12638 [Saprolegnia diclina VS20]|uniref:Temptin Cys/Cys disulfide domain-containing protein n=1 Tax=Saprolegnia diclina (strain VS20) TaxID=1156394 RepID=T0PVU4_SAPDV|nr:hypothetical protein SDRG_12638 [Saprolegnia diclina VS20]EQC29634.1 hypothetical protein SDRG_12638 [Saprolegnia diclina VS20]|eukprot:XP_008616938.1 hypothetical protein SDRG_12638 [Saprolegnia diclina VS20]
MQWITTALALSTVVARPAYVIRLPNGGNVPGVPALGHADPDGRDRSLNAFGNAFSKYGSSWTKTLCQLDSDGDGATNGEELLDPCCTWTQGGSLALSSFTPTDPGVKNPFSSDQLAALKCGSNATMPPSSVAVPSSSSSKTSDSSVTLSWSSLSVLGTTLVVVLAV